MRAPPRQADVMLCARKPGGAGGRLDRSVACGIRGDVDPRIREQPEHIPIAVVRRPCAGTSHSPARELHVPGSGQDARLLVEARLIAGDDQSVAPFQLHPVSSVDGREAASLSHRDLHFTPGHVDAPAVLFREPDRGVLENVPPVRVRELVLEVEREGFLAVGAVSRGRAATGFRDRVRARSRRGGRPVRGRWSAQSHDDDRHEDDHERGYYQPGGFLPAHQEGSRSPLVLPSFPIPASCSRLTLLAEGRPSLAGR